MKNSTITLSRFCEYKSEKFSSKSIASLSLSYPRENNTFSVGHTWYSAPWGIIFHCWKNFLTMNQKGGSFIDRMK